MTTNYPTTIDSYTTHVDGDTIEPEYDNNQQDAIIALQTKLGVDNSAVTTTIDYKVKSTSSLDPGHKHTPTVSLAITGTPDGTKYLRDDNTWSQPPTVADASTTVKGSSKTSVAPASASDPIVVGDNDPRVPTQGENDALVGNNTDIAVGTGNKFVTQTGQQKNAEKYAADAGGSDTYAITLSPVPTSYSTGMVVYFKANTANTGTATINVNSLGAKTIVKGVSTTLSDGDIAAGMFCTIIYDGTNFVLQNPIVSPRASSGTITISSSTTTTITLGYRPRHITIHSTNGGSSGGLVPATSHGGYDATTANMWCVYTSHNTSGSVNASGQSSSYSLNITYGSSPSATTATIGNITDTGFDIVSTLGTATPVCYWTAIG